MTVEELNIDIEAIVSKCQGGEISVTTARKHIQKTFIKWCDENNIYLHEIGRVPHNPYRDASFQEAVAYDQGKFGVLQSLTSVSEALK